MQGKSACWAGSFSSLCACSLPYGTISVCAAFYGLTSAQNCDCTHVLQFVNCTASLKVHSRIFLCRHSLDFSVSFIFDMSRSANRCAHHTQYGCSTCCCQTRANGFCNETVQTRQTDRCIQFNSRHFLPS